MILFVSLELTASAKRQRLLSSLPRDTKQALRRRRGTRAAISSRVSTPGTPAERSYRYVALGANLESDLPLPQLPAAADASGPTLRIVRATAMPEPRGALVFEQPGPDGELVYALYKDGDAYCWTYPRVGRFAVSASQRTIRWWPTGHSEDVAALLSGPVLGFALQLLGRHGLHGNALVYGAAAFGLLGPSGAGKSTLSAALMRSGCALLTDDILAIEMEGDAARVSPSLQRLKLWPDSLEHLGQEGWRSLDSFVSWMDKRVLAATRIGEVCDAPRPLAALFAMLPEGAAAPVELRRAQGMDALMLLVASAYQAHLMGREPALLAAQLAHFQQVAERVPVFGLRCPRSFARLPEVTASVLRQLAALSAVEA